MWKDVLTGKAGFGEVFNLSSLINLDDQVGLEIIQLQTELFTCVHPGIDNQQLLYQTKSVRVL